MNTCPNCQHANPDGARFCSNCGRGLEVSKPIEGERKFATVLFADVANSTAIAERLDPEDWTLIMNGAFGFMNAAVSRYGGTVSRLMGDAVLALFGAPVSHEDDAERAVRAGLEIQDMAKPYAMSVGQRYGVDFELRVGINTGTAVLAFVGDAAKTEYTAMGDAANVAARLQSAAAPGTVLVSADTHRLVRNIFDVESHGAIAMKGKLEPVETFLVLGPKAVPGSPRGLQGLSSPLVGRDTEIELLNDKLAALQRGIGSAVAVVGEAGLGKSRLIAELRGRASGQPLDWFETRGISYGQSIPYYPWRQLGRQIVGAEEMDDGGALRQKLADFVKRLGLSSTDIPFLETMLAVDSAQSRIALGSLAGEAIVNGVAGAVVNAIRAMIRAGGRPHALVLDDLHWADSATLELVAQVAALAAFEPLLIVCILRPDRKAASWSILDRLQGSLASSYARIDLEPLRPEDSGELLGNLLHIEDLPQSIRAQILERSEGNPFYLEEVLRSLIDGGQVVREEGHWRATSSILDVKIPDTLAGVLSARIDRLPESTKRVAQTAAVIGRTFMHRVLETVCRTAPGPERIEHVEPHVATLTLEQLVRERARDPEREYSFKHALTCEAAYELLLRSRRKQLHARTGEALESLFAERRDELAPMLAHHFAEAEDFGRAVQYWRQAAENASRLYAAREEVQHRDNIVAALERMPDADPGDLIDATVEWATLRHRLNTYEGVVERLEKAIALARRVKDKERLATALTWLANIHIVTGFPSRSGPYLEESQLLAHQLGKEQLLLLPLFMGTINLVDRNPREAVDRMQEIIDMARAQKVNEVMAHAMSYRAVALARIGEVEAAKAQIAEALEAAPDAGSPVKEADVHIGVALAYYDLGDIETGLKHAHIGAERALAARGFECACAGYYGVAKGEFERHRLEDSLIQYGRSLEIADKIGWDGGGYVNAVRGGLAVAEIESGTQSALEKLRIAIRNAESINDEYSAATLSEQLARALLRQGRKQEARSVLASAIGYYSERGMRPYLDRAEGLQRELEEGAGAA